MTSEGSNLRALRQSASLILTLTDDDERVLMLNRKPHMSFANSLVFPGGACDPQDAECLDMDAPFIEFAKLTAVRETFEETGILLVPSNCIIQYNLSHLKELYASRNQKAMAEVVYTTWKDHLSQLEPIARFVTPQLPKTARFDCIFYVARVGVYRINLGSSYRLEQLDIHLEESSKYSWCKPIEYIRQMKEGKVFLPPPQNLILNVMAVKGHSLQRWNVDIEPFIGQFSSNKEFMLPGDSDYDYEIFSKQDPQSPTKSQICQYLTDKKASVKPGNRRRFQNIFPRQIKDPSKPVALLSDQKQTSFLRYLSSPRPSL